MSTGCAPTWARVVDVALSIGPILIKEMREFGDAGHTPL